MKQFSALAGGVALGVIMIPIVTRTTEEMIRLVPASLREGALALGAPQWRVTMGVVLPAAGFGHRDGRDAGDGARLGRDGAASVYGLRQPLLQRLSRSAHRAA